MATSKTCPVCGITFVDPKHPNKICCSRECFAQSRRRLVEVPCQECGSLFSKKPALEQRFCSTKCRVASRLKVTPRLQGKRATFTCEWCGKSFESWIYRNPRFCSRKCTGAYALTINTDTRHNSRKRPENYVTLYCDICSKEYTLHKGVLEMGRKSRFCSNECRYKGNSLDKMGAGNPNYIGGTQFPDRGVNWSAQRKAAIKRDGSTCQICGKKPRKGQKRVVDVHHIIPYRVFNGDFLRANELSNLITLCRKCHRQVECGQLACPKRLI